MRIGELSRRTGVSIRLLRYYEEQGLLMPQRRPSGYREYREEDVATVRGIRTLLGAGLGTATIARLLPCMVDDGENLAPGCHGLLPDLHQERERIDEAMASLLAARDALDTIIATPVPAPPAAGGNGAGTIGNGPGAGTGAGEDGSGAPPSTGSDDAASAPSPTWCAVPDRRGHGATATVGT
ncbi:MerR family transcriptional regulator [Streptomyces pactum]|uniref:MerR family transcriptional regulator n=1 Tax=Streptomyces pactum TaxID=68249 RepID=A0ABS0NMQ5_9ACTN|nr:MerR family transcriptional regulator [Streptomyces pactum]